jgi:hypothetical protein
MGVSGTDVVSVSRVLSKTVVQLNNQNLDIKCSAHDAFLE